MTKSYDSVQCVKDNMRVYRFIAVELCKIFDLSDASLIEFEVVLLQAQSDLFKQVVDDCHFKIMMKLPKLGD